MEVLDATLHQWVAEELVELRHTGDFEVRALKAEASHRHFYRILPAGNPTGSLVLMSSPPDRENNQAFEHLAEVFAAHGVCVPSILARQRESGWYLLSDLGTLHLEQAYQQDSAASLELALDALLKIQTIPEGAVPSYTVRRFHDELAICREWLVEAWLGETFPAQDLDDVFAGLANRTEDQPQVCVHRDFHCRNLLPGDGVMGVVDFQDALFGPTSYDLSSLLHDCYYRFTPAEVARWRQRYLERSRLPLDPQTFAADVDLMAAQRLLKAAGIFARLQLRDQKTSHLRYIPSTLAHVATLCGPYKDLAALPPHLLRWAEAAARKLEDAG